MADETTHLFSHKETVELLIKKQGIHQGLWRLAIEFGFGAGNLGPAPDQISPAAIVTVARIGIKQSEAEDALTVDAAKVNPEPAR